MKNALRTLRVPLHYQPTASNLCGSACMRMVLRHYGERRSLDWIVRDLRGRTGTTAEHLALWAMKHGYDATVIGWYRPMPQWLLPLDDDTSHEELLRWCRQASSRDDDYRRGLRRRIALIVRGGGTYLPRPVTRLDLVQAIRRRIPPLLLVDFGVLYGTRENAVAHFVVVTGIGRDRIRLNDPYPGYGGRREYDLDRVLHACYVCDSTAVFLRPKDP